MPISKILSWGMTATKIFILMCLSLFPESMLLSMWNQLALHSNSLVLNSHREDSIDIMTALRGIVVL